MSLYVFYFFLENKRIWILNLDFEFSTSQHDSMSNCPWLYHLTSLPDWRLHPYVNFIARSGGGISSTAEVVYSSKLLFNLLTGWHQEEQLAHQNLIQISMAWIDIGLIVTEWDISQNGWFSLLRCNLSVFACTDAWHLILVCDVGVTHVKWWWWWWWWWWGIPSPQLSPWLYNHDSITTDFQYNYPHFITTDFNTTTLTSSPQTSIQLPSLHHHRLQYNYLHFITTDFNTTTLTSSPQTSIQLPSLHYHRLQYNYPHFITTDFNTTTLTSSPQTSIQLPSLHHHRLQYNYPRFITIHHITYHHVTY